MKERIFRSLPLIAALAGTYSFMVTDDQWTLIIALAGVWLMESPVPGTVAVVRALKRSPDVSRETFGDDPGESVAEYIQRTTTDETITSPCAFLHGSAEPHVPGCEGWTFDLP